MLKSGKELTSTISKKYVVVKLLGEGNQGEVYEVQSEGKKYALKWYLINQATKEQLENLKKLVSIGSPTDKFLWPMDIIISNETFGYIMPLRENNFYSLNALVKRKIEPSFEAICTASYELANSYLQLHSKGMSYKDISLNNVFIEEKTGDIRICDNDNVAFADNLYDSVLGTPMFMAPEIVMGKARPSIETDLHSLSVLIFHILMLGHPLDGQAEYNIKCKDSYAMNILYGSNPVFIWDPNNSSNRPVKNYHTNPIIYWELYPEIIKNLFIKTFTDGLNDPNKRVRESEWRKAFITLRDSILFCDCKVENFYDIDKVKTKQKNICWNCKKEIKTPPRMKIDSNILMLTKNTKIYKHHLGTPYNFKEISGEVVQNPTNPNIFGIKNLSKDKWTVTKEDGSVLEIEPSKSITISPNLKINFGQVSGEIRF